MATQERGRNCWARASTTRQNHPNGDPAEIEIRTRKGRFEIIDSCGGKLHDDINAIGNTRFNLCDGGGCPRHRVSQSQTTERVRELSQQASLFYYEVSSRLQIDRFGRPCRMFGPQQVTDHVASRTPHGMHHGQAGWLVRVIVDTTARSGGQLLRTGGSGVGYGRNQAARNREANQIVGEL